MGFDMQETLQQMLQQLDICQKALSNFLEDKRSAFPRFYFIGDDDLLEVVIKQLQLLCNLTNLLSLVQHGVTVVAAFEGTSYTEVGL